MCEHKSWSGVDWQGALMQRGIMGVLLWSERENQQDATVRRLLSILSQHVLDITMPIFRRTRRVLLHVVCCTGSAECGW